MTLCVCFSENGPKSGRYVCPVQLVVFCIFMSISKTSDKEVFGEHCWTMATRFMDVQAARAKLSRTSIGAGAGPSSSSKMDHFTDPLVSLRNQPGCHKNGDKPLRRRWDQNRSEGDLTCRRQEKLTQSRRTDKRPNNLQAFDDAISPLQRVTDRVNELVAVAAPLDDDRARLRPGPCAHLPIVRKSTVPFASPSQRLAESCPPLPSISHPRIDLRRATGLRARLHSSPS